MGGRERRRLYELLKSFYEGVMTEDYFEDSAEQRLYRKIYFETFRHLGFIEKCLSNFCKEKPGAELQSALVLGACQILFMDDIPEYAAVNESVSLVKQNKRSFVNAVLRNITRQKTELMKNYSVREDFPEWFVKRWEARLGTELDAFLEDLNKKPSFYAVDEKMQLRKTEDKTDDYIMDRASFSVAGLAGDFCPMSVLDCCAAPGGKTYVLSQKYPDARVFAVEKNPARFESMKKNFSELGLGNVDCVRSDIMTLETEAEFDLILLDAPCTALGTIKRHPEIRWLRTEKDIRENAVRQAAMLEKVSGFVADGGRIIYSVCSTEPEETSDVIEAFLHKHKEFKLIKPSCDEDFISGQYFVSIPFRNDADGFFGAVMTK
jgi:16S rRNA (cytosine967-C5)-methyltransferase